MKKPARFIFLSMIGFLVIIASIIQIQLIFIADSPKEQLYPRASAKLYGLLPIENIPTGNLNISQGSTEIALSFAEIVNRTTTENASIPLHRWEIFIQGVWHNITGINPLHLIELVKFGHARTISFWSSTEESRIIDINELVMHDSNYYKNAVNNATILALTIDDQWINSFNESFGTTVLFGDGYTEDMIIKDVNRICIETEWVVNITLDGIKVGEISRLNRTDTFLNYTTYTWGYFDNKSSTSWGPNECTGYTLKSIIKLFNTGDCLCFPPKEGNYNVSFIALDGYGASKKYGKTGIENGFISDIINDPAIPLENQGKLAILMDTINNKPIDYSRGPYQFIAPGLLKGNYIGQVVEIRILTITNESPSTTTGTTSSNTTIGNIPGYSMGILLGCFILAVCVVFSRYRRIY